MKLSDFTYEFPKELIAQHPLEKRDASKMLVLHRQEKSFIHAHIQNITQFLNKKDLLVFNDTKVFPARLFGEDGHGRKMEVLLLEKISRNMWRCLAQPLKKISSGDLLKFGADFFARVIKKGDGFLEMEFLQNDFEAKIKKFGHTPLPPYIKRLHGEENNEDRERYQSVFAKNPGSSAAPTASLHFSEELLQKIKEAGIQTAFVTLHVSIDTFLPIREENILDHKMHGERFSVPTATLKKIAETKKAGGRVLAMGTTVARALESDFSNEITNIFIHPGFHFKTVDAMLTNFHQPHSTLLLLVSAFAGKEFVLEAYKEAIAKKYRLFSYGDCMLIL